VRYANQHKLKIAIRGDGHSRYGQTQAEAGVVTLRSKKNKPTKGLVPMQQLTNLRVSAP
jgi:FAD/FMN-containing dehydrogenase